MCHCCKATGRVRRCLLPGILVSIIRDLLSKDSAEPLKSWSYSYSVGRNIEIKSILKKLDSKHVETGIKLIRIDDNTWELQEVRDER